MRTKTLLLSAAVGAAGLLAANAQVYSVNSVGYINLTVPPGFSMISNQLKTTANTLADILPNPPDGTQVLSWNGTGFVSYDFIGALGVWSPDGDLALNPGEGVFIRNPTTSDMTITLVGEVPQNADSNSSIPSGFSIRSSTVPMQGDLVDDMAFPSADGDQVLKWNGSGYVSFDYIGALSVWSPSNPTVNVGEAFFSRKGAQASWARNFSVNN
jgi:hypothetical protein